ncbi:MAG: hypothetical protein AABW80_00220 [Nanoarchaeota archaeon]
MWDGAPVRVVAGLRNGKMDEYAKLDILCYPEKVEKIAKKRGWRFHHERRFEPFVKYFGPLQDDFWTSIVMADKGVRDFYDGAINWMAFKTISFWHLCIGGENLLPLDVHLLRTLRTDFGLKIDEKYFTGKRRKRKKFSRWIVQKGLFGVDFDYDDANVQSVRSVLSRADYSRVEREAQELFSRDERFVENGRLNNALVAGVLWWKGAQRGEYGAETIFGKGEHGFDKLPYGDLSRFKV